uniref:Uncharacterized protein n=1 Tax=Triticum urartu TaxID=4572 RepID=A0A8R7QAZ1_TRIUA
MSSCSIRNPKTFVASTSNATSKSLRKSNTKDYKNGRLPTLQEYSRLPTLQEYSRLPTPKTTQPGGGQYQKQSQFYNCVEDMNLSNGPRDATATPGEAREDTPMEISWIRKKLLNMRKGISMKKTQVPSNYPTGHSQILPSSMAYSEGSSKILGSPINTTTEKDPQLSCTMHKGTNDTSSSKGVDNMEMQFHNKDDTNARNLIDLNVALPFMDEMEIDAHAPESDTIPQEPDDSSNHVVTAAKNLTAMHKVEFQAGLPEGNNNDDDSNALKQQLFKTKHHISSSTPLSKENKSCKDHGVASASTLNVPDKSNSSTATPPEGCYARYPGF